MLLFQTLAFRSAAAAAAVVVVANQRTDLNEIGINSASAISEIAIRRVDRKSNNTPSLLPERILFGPHLRLVDVDYWKFHRNFPAAARRRDTSPRLIATETNPPDDRDNDSGHSGRSVRPSNVTLF